MAGELSDTQLGILALSVLSDPISVTIVFPLVPYLVQDFYQFSADEQYKVGYYAGLLASCYMIAQVISTKFWTSLSDRVGRRPVLLFGMLSNVACMIAFGLAPNYMFCLAARFMQGLLNTNIAVAKCYLSDVTTDKTENKSFVVIGMCFGTGSILGPVIGGYLSQPAAKYPSVFSPNGFFAAFPYFLPFLVVAVYVCINFVFAYMYLPESLRHFREVPVAPITEQGGGYGSLETSNNDKSSSSSSRGSRGSDADLEKAPLLTPSSTATAAAAAAAEARGTLSHLLMFAPFRMLLLVNFAYGVTFMATQEVLPVWARGDPSKGGVGFTTSDIGTIQAVGGLTAVLATSLLFSRVADAIGLVHTLRVGLLVLTLGFGVPLWLSLLRFSREQWGSWLALSFGSIFTNLGCSFCFPAMDIMTKNCIPPDCVGAGVGLRATVQKAGYALGPLGGGALFAWSAKARDSLPFILSEGRLFYFVSQFALLVVLCLTIRFPAWPWRRPV